MFENKRNQFEILYTLCEIDMEDKKEKLESILHAFGIATEEKEDD